MADKETLDKFNEMFDLVSSDDENDQAEEYGHSTGSEESFEELSKELSKEISSEIKDLEEKLVVVKETPHDIIMEVSSKVESDYEKPEKEKCADNPDDIDEMFDSLDEEDVQVIIEEESKNVEQETEDDLKKASEIIEDFCENECNKISLKEEDETLKEEVVESDFEIKCSKNEDIVWSLKSPSDMYIGFYRQKKAFLDRCLYGGQIEYSRWTKELEEAEVDVVSEVFDQHVIIGQMEAVQQYRNRVKYIGVRVNNQFYAFDRFIGLLRGYLARIQYLKPVLKQDGLILEHMGDIELYFERLRALHNSVASTEKNLAASYEMLSRKVTICMEIPPAERWEKPSSSQSYTSKHVPQKEVEENKELSDFDSLPENARTGTKEKVSGAIGWGDI